MKLAILGASGHGRVAADLAEITGWTSIVFFDDKFHGQDKNENWPISGTTKDLISKYSEYDGIFVAIGNNEVRNEKVNELVEAGAQLISLIHPTAVISRYAVVGDGTIVMANSVVNAFTIIGAASIINTSSSVDHDCNIGKAVHISPGANLAGNVTIGDYSWIGIGASVVQEIKIGKSTIIGAGAAVVANIPDSVVALGVPAKY